MSSRLPASALWNQRVLQPTSPFKVPPPFRHATPTNESPLADGILPENLHGLEGDRGLGVDLWTQWPGMLAGLQAIGETLVITCSECAVLGKYLAYPAFTVDRVRGLASDFEGEFDFSFDSWSQARALHLRSDQGHQYGVEFRDAGGHTLHKLCLTAESRLDDFLEWVQIHQATRPDSTLPWQRLPAIEETEITESIPPEAHVFVDPCRLRHWLAAAIQQEMPIRALVGNSGAVQGHCFVPRNLRTQGPWYFCSSDEVGLHIDPLKISQLILHNIAIDEPPCWTLKAYGADGQLSLALAPTAPAHRTAWAALTRGVFQDLQD